MPSCPIIRFTGVLYEKLVKHERWIFLLFLLISLLQLWMTRFIPSLDGPQHLYNANVMVELLKGNELMRSFFDINEVIVGYWSGHFFLSFFKLFFPAWLAEKLFLTTYVLAMVFSFRYLVRAINPSKGNFVAFLIFPFVYHSYLLMGYYSFSIGAIFFFLAFGYWIRYQDQMTLKRIIVFGLMVLGIFLSHGLVYLFFGISFLIFFFSSTFYRISTKSDKFKLKLLLNKAGSAVLSFIPSLILWIIYIRSVMSINSTIAETSFSFAELVKFLMRIKLLEGFYSKIEAPGYILLFALMALLSIVFLVLFISRLKDKSEKITMLFSDQNSWIFIALVFLGLYLFAPDRISAGNLTNRFGLFFFFGLIIWLSAQKFPRTFQVLALLIILFSVIYARSIHHRFYKQYNKDISEICELSEYMEPNSVMYYLPESQHWDPDVFKLYWTQIHFQLYAVVDAPLVHLKNPQCQGQFPVVWNLETLPRCFAGPKQVNPSGAPEVPDTYPEMEVDYITIFYNDRYWNDSTNAEWQGILKEYYEEVYVSSGGKAALWRRKGSR